MLRNYDRLEEQEQTVLGTDQNFVQYRHAPEITSTVGDLCGSEDEWQNGVSLATYLAGGYSCDCPFIAPPDPYPPPVPVVHVWGPGPIPNVTSVAGRYLTYALTCIPFPAAPGVVTINGVNMDLLGASPANPNGMVFVYGKRVAISGVQTFAITGTTPAILNAEVCDYDGLPIIDVETKSAAANAPPIDSGQIAGSPTGPALAYGVACFRSSGLPFPPPHDQDNLPELIWSNHIIGIGSLFHWSGRTTPVGQGAYRWRFRNFVQPINALASVLVTINFGGAMSVQSVGLSLPASTFDVTHSPVTTSDTILAPFKVQTAATFLAGPGSGAAAVPDWRLLIATDLDFAYNAIPDDGVAVFAQGVGFRDTGAFWAHATGQWHFPGPSGATVNMFDGRTLAANNASFGAEFVTGTEAGRFSDGVHTVLICDNTNAITYGPAAPGNWTAAAPTDVWVALDRLAAWIAANFPGPPPP